MALYDWNRDGKKDWQDDYIEYQVYKDMTDQNKQSEQKSPFGSGGGSSGGMSSFGAMAYSIHKTLRFELRPQGRVQEYNEKISKTFNKERCNHYY